MHKTSYLFDVPNGMMALLGKKAKIVLDHRKLLVYLYI